MQDYDEMTLDGLSAAVRASFGPYSNSLGLDPNAALDELSRRAGTRTVECPSCGEEFDSAPGGGVL